MRAIQIKLLSIIKYFSITFIQTVAKAYYYMFLYQIEVHDYILCIVIQNTCIMQQ